MPLLRSCLLSSALASSPLAGQEAPKDPAPKPADPAPATAEPAPAPKVAEATPPKSSDWEDGGCRGWRHHRHHHHGPAFGAYAQALKSQNGLKEALDGGMGYGVGVQWVHEHGPWSAGRTRLEWNTFAEGDPVPPLGVRTYAKNYLLSFDHLFLLNRGSAQAYLVVGAGGVRWNLQQTDGVARTNLWTTKLALTGGVGVRFGQRANLEARCVVGSLKEPYDGTTVQVALGWGF